MATSTTGLLQLQPNLEYGLPHAQRHITTIDSEGKSIFVPQRDLLYADRGGYAVSWGYATSSFPAPLNNDRDLEDFLTDDPNSKSSYVNTGTRIVNGAGLVMNTTNFSPGVETVMHRTVSLDLVAIVEGEMELELDSGEKVLLKAGDSIIQRQTMHRWRNRSKDKPARLISVIVAADTVTINGKSFGLEGFSHRMGNKN